MITKIPIILVAVYIKDKNINNKLHVYIIIEIYTSALVNFDNHIIFTQTTQ